MARLYQMTTLAQVEEETESRKNRAGDFKAYSRESVESWLKSVGGSVSKNNSKASNDICKRINSVIGGTPSDYLSLIDAENIHQLCGDFHGIRDVLQGYHDRQRFTSKLDTNALIHMCLYVNSLGIEQVLDTTNALRALFSNSKRSKSTPSSRDKNIETDPSTFTIDDIKRLLHESTRHHTVSENVQIAADASLEDITTLLKEVITAPTLNTCNIITECAYQFIEPRYAERMFLQSVVDFELVEPSEELINTVAIPLIANRTINILNDRLSELRVELFRLVLPRRFTLTDADSTAALDVLLPVLLGADSAHTMAFYELCTFQDAVGLSGSDKLLQVIRTMENSIKLDLSQDSFPSWKIGAETNRWILQNMKCQFGKQVCFILWLELCRRFITFFENTLVGSVSQPSTVPKDKIDQTGGEVRRSIPHNVIYFYGGMYYGQWKSTDSSIPSVAIKSTCYKTLLSQVIRTCVIN